MKHSILLISSLLFAFVNLSVQQSSGVTLAFNLVNGTQQSWPLLNFNISAPFPEILITYSTTIFANSSFTVTTQFFDVNTSEVLYTTIPFSYGFDGFPGMNVSVNSAAKITPCDITKWNATNRFVGARTNIIFASDANTTTVMYQSITLTSTLVTATSGTPLSSSVAKYITLQTPVATPNIATGPAPQQYQANITIQRSGNVALPFSSYCLYPLGSCGNCVTQGKISSSDTAVVISANLPPATYFFVDLVDVVGTNNVLFSLSTTMTPITTPTTGTSTSGVSLISPLWGVSCIAFGMALL